MGSFQMNQQVTETLTQSRPQLILALTMDNVKVYLNEGVEWSHRI